MPHNSAGTNNNSQMNKILASSTSLLANDSYMAGMSSDSELTSGSRHHHRPYSSQSRVYHAHPAPRNAHSNSSRLSHYSDSVASYMPSCGPSSLQRQPLNQTQKQDLMNNQVIASSSHHLSHQSSIASSGSGGSGSAYFGVADQSLISALQQQQQEGLPIKHNSIRQLPTRPFKQSMSIDHHALGQYHHQQQLYDIHQSRGNVLGQMSSPIHTSSVAMSSQNIHPNASETNLEAYQSKQKLINSPHEQQIHQRVTQISSLDQRYRIPKRSDETNFNGEMDMIEKQTENINLYENNASQSGLPHRTAANYWQQSVASSYTHQRQLPPTNISSMSVDQMHYQKYIHQPHHSGEASAGVNNIKDAQQYQQDLYDQQQVNLVPADWLPPMGPSAHNLNRTSQSKQADQYIASQHPSFPSNQNYAASRNPNFTGTEFPAANQFYRPNSANYGSSSQNYDPSIQQQHYLTAITSGNFQAKSKDELHNESKYSQQYNEYHRDQQPNQNSSQKSINSSSMIYSKSPAIGSQTIGAPVMNDNLQHQMSSSSSNSQSGSLRSSNIDVTKSGVGGDNQKSGAISNIRRQHHGLLKKGSTSALSGLSNSNSALNEPSSGSNDISSSPNRVHSTSVGITNPVSRLKSAMRAASPSIGAEGGSVVSYGSTSSQQPHHHHSSSSAKDGAPGSRSESSTGLPNGSNGNSNNSSLAKKSNSATQLSMTGTKKRLGFRKKQVTSFSVHRSEEVAPLEARHLVKQGSSVSEGDSSMSGDSSSRSWSNSNFKQQTSDELASMSFIDGLGKGQMISRQGLASPYLGDIQLSLCDRRGNLEIEVIRARNLQAKANKILPLTYVKLYLVKNRKCLAKAKTTLSNERTLDPLFQQQLTFHEDYHGCILQSIIWGNFGKMDKKNFMGIAQISIDDLELSDTVISWYKLFLPSSLQTLPSKSLRHTLLSNSTESFTNTNNS